MSCVVSLGNPIARDMIQLQKQRAGTHVEDGSSRIESLSTARLQGVLPLHVEEFLGDPADGLLDEVSNHPDAAGPLTGVHCVTHRRLDHIPHGVAAFGDVGLVAHVLAAAQRADDGAQHVSTGRVTAAGTVAPSGSADRSRDEILEDAGSATATAAVSTAQRVSERRRDETAHVDVTGAFASMLHGGTGWRRASSATASDHAHDATQQVRGASAAALAAVATPATPDGDTVERSRSHLA